MLEVFLWLKLAETTVRVKVCFSFDTNSRIFCATILRVPGNSQSVF